MEEITVTNHFHFSGIVEEGAEIGDTIPRDSTLKWMVGCKYECDVDCASSWFLYQGVVHTRTVNTVESLKERFPCYTWKNDSREFSHLVKYYVRLAKERGGEVLYRGNQQRFVDALDAPSNDKDESTDAVSLGDSKNSEPSWEVLPKMILTTSGHGFYHLVTWERGVRIGSNTDAAGLREEIKRSPWNTVLRLRE